MTAKTVIRNAIKKHGIKLEHPYDSNVQALVRYALYIGSNEGFLEAEEMLKNKKRGRTNGELEN